MHHLLWGTRAGDTALCIAGGGHAKERGHCHMALLLLLWVATSIESFAHSMQDLHVACLNDIREGLTLCVQLQNAASASKSLC